MFCRSKVSKLDNLSFFFAFITESINFKATFAHQIATAIFADIAIDESDKKGNQLGTTKLCDSREKTPEA